MIYVTGDTHGDVKRLGSKMFNARDGDTVIICGDFGLIWNYKGMTKTEKYWLDWLDEKPFITCFVDGNHENFDRLNDFPIEEWNGGKIHRISKNVIHLMRGQVFTIEGKKIFTMGGALSHDIDDGIIDSSSPGWRAEYKNATAFGKMMRINRVSWWKEELPNQNEYSEAWENLKKNEYKVDYIITHEAPTSIVYRLYAGMIMRNNELSDFLNIVYKTAEFERWFCGHHHINNDGFYKITMLYDDIVNAN